jgi:predicted AAA+ superfamily ATPase
VELNELFALSQTFLRLRYREFRRSFLDDNLLTGRFNIIIGQRGVGKTTVLVQHLLAHGDERTSPRILYLPADHFLVGRSSLYEISDAFVKMGGELLCFDEIHKYPAWSQELKSICDTFPSLKILASGSSALEITKGSHDLSRRALVYRMHGLSFREFIILQTGISLERLTLAGLLANHRQAADTIVATLETAGHKVLALFRDYLQKGFYPYFLEYPDLGQFQMTLEQNIHTTLESDLPAIHQTLSGGSIRKIARLLAIIASMVPYTPDMKSLKGMLEIGDERTLKTYLKYLEDAGVILTVTRSGKGLRELEKPEKIYLNNPNLCYALTGGSAPDSGALRETFLLSMLRISHRVTAPARGDFLVDDTITIEVGGKGKDGRQLLGIENGWLALDSIETGSGIRVPLWLFGFLN